MIHVTASDHAALIVIIVVLCVVAFYGYKHKWFGDL